MDFPVPVAIVQHRDKTSDDTLCKPLQSACALPVTDAQDKELILPGHVYLAPADYHLLVDRDGFALSTEGKVRHSRPSIDVLFESAANAFDSGVVGVILTGASEDGARGTARIKERGGLVVVQDPTTAESPVMPAAAAAADSVYHILPLTEIPVFLAKLGQPRKGSA